MASSVRSCVGGLSVAFGERSIWERHQWGAAAVGWETRMVPDAPEGEGSCKQKSKTAALSSLSPVFSCLLFLLSLHPQSKATSLPFGVCSPQSSLLVGMRLGEEVGEKEQKKARREQKSPFKPRPMQESG